MNLHESIEDYVRAIGNEVQCEWEGELGKMKQREVQPYLLEPYISIWLKAFGKRAEG